jgi:hypothetical protein
MLARGRDEVTDHGGFVVEACITAIEASGTKPKVKKGLIVNS